MITRFSSTYSTPDEDDRPCDVEIADDTDLGMSLVVIDADSGEATSVSDLSVEEEVRLDIEANRAIEYDRLEAEADLAALRAGLS